MDIVKIDFDGITAKLPQVLKLDLDCMPTLASSDPKAWLTAISRCRISC